MGSLTFSEIVTIALVVLIVFGPNRLPELSRKIGQFLAWGRRSMQDFTNQINAEFGDETQPLADLRKDVEGVRDDLKGAMDAVTKPLSTPLAPDQSPEPRVQSPDQAPHETPDTGPQISEQNPAPSAQRPDGDPQAPSDELGATQGSALDAQGLDEGEEVS